MTPHNPVSIPALPSPLRWRGVPVSWSLDADDALTLTAGARTDWFIDPAGAANLSSAPALLMPISQPGMLKAHITVEAASTFDAGVLVVFHADQVWAKLCLERSPQGQLMVVSVVTKGVSDDCNSLPITGSSIFYRIARLENSYAFHYSVDGALWHMVRHFTLGDLSGAQIGLLAQSPTGDGCRVHFQQIAYLHGKLADLRSGV